MDIRRRLAFWICPDLRAEVRALQEGNTKVVLENERLLDQIEGMKARYSGEIPPAEKRARAAALASASAHALR